MAKVGFYVSTHHPLSMNMAVTMAYAFKTHPLDTVHAKIITGIHYEERAQCKVHDKKCFQHHPRSRARAQRARHPSAATDDDNDVYEHMGYTSPWP